MYAKKNNYNRGGRLEEMLAKYMNGGMMMYDNGGKNGRKNKNEGPVAPEGAEKGTIFYDKDSQGFYQVMPAGNLNRIESTAALERALPKGALGFVTREGSGDPALDEFYEKYSDIAPTFGSMEGDDQNQAGYRSSVRKAVAQALRTGDPALMSALLNPVGGEGAIMGIEPANFEGAGFRSTFTPRDQPSPSLVNLGDGEIGRIQAGTVTEDGYQMRRPNPRDLLRMLEQK